MNQTQPVHLHDYQYQPDSLMNTTVIYFSLHVIPYPGVDHLIGDQVELEAQFKVTLIRKHGEQIRRPKDPAHLSVTFMLTL